MTIQMMKWQLEEWIRDYKFMLREIKRLDKILNGGFCREPKLTATYGIEASLPKGSSGISQAELDQEEEREQRMKRYQEVTKTLQKASSLLYAEKFRIVYDCMLEGMSYRAIARHMGVSRDTVHSMKENILEIIVRKGQEDHSLPLLKLDKDSNVELRASRTGEAHSAVSNL